MLKKAGITILAAVMLVSISGTAMAADTGTLDHFQKTQSYQQGHFTDVSAKEWYASSVAAAYEYNLINGTSPTTFAPNANITLAETLTLAARLSDIYYADDEYWPVAYPWYKPYIDYCIMKGIITESDFTDYTKKASRQQFAYIMARALPDEAYKAINNIELGSLPDVAGNNYFAPYIYKLYNAGILSGNDIFGTFAPVSNIRRSEVSAIVTRLADESLRKHVVLVEKLSAPTFKNTWKLDNSGFPDAAGIGTELNPVQGADGYEYKYTFIWGGGYTSEYGVHRTTVPYVSVFFQDYNDIKVEARAYKNVNGTAIYSDWTTCYLTRAQINKVTGMNL